MDAIIPCLFDYATSELSQDAFFAWLLANADDSCFGAVHELGRLFLKKAFESNGKSLPQESIHIEVSRQYKNIDVFATINETEAALILEDKVHTREHGTQLTDYRDTILNEAKYKNVICLYCKTGDQSDVDPVKQAGYAIFDRSVILGILVSQEGKLASLMSDIVADFTKHLLSLNQLVEGYKTKLFEDWDWNDWKGFYMALQVELGEGDWNYVSNPAGGFMGFWWHWREVDGGSVYLQLEEEKACFKVEVEDWDAVQDLKVGWNERFIAVSERISNLAFRVIRPKVLRKGTWMTVAIIDKEYRVENNGSLDLAATVKNIRDMETILDEAVRKFQEAKQDGETNMIPSMSAQNEMEADK